MSLIRGTSLQGFVELVTELGGDPDALLAQAHLGREVVGDHDTFIGYRSVTQVLEAAARVTGAGDLGRRLADRQGLEILGPLGVAARTAPTVGEALAAVEQYMSFYSPALAIGLRVDADRAMAVLEWRIVDHHPPVHRQAAELALGVAVRVVRLLAGPGFLPTSVQIRHEALTERASYTRYFGSPVEFSADGYSFRFPLAVLARPLDADGDVHAVVQEYLGTVVGPSEPTTADVVARLVRRMLPTGALDLDLVASQLAQHRRTLQRRLAEQGTTFAELVDRVRREEAERYLRDTDMPLGQLSGALGFSEQSALSRACVRWYGAPPSRVRRDLRARE